MNILLATDASLERGGITLFMLQWIKGIRKAYPDSSIHVYFRDHIEDEGIKEQYESLGTSIYIGNIPQSVKFGVRSARRQVKDDIRGIIQNADIDVIHINSGIFGYNMDLLAEAKRLGIKTRIAHSHGAYPERPIDKFVHFFLTRAILYNATAYAGCSKKAGEYLFGKAGVNSRRWRFIPNAINTEKFRFDENKRSAMRRTLNITENETLLGAVGHLNAGKNHLFLLDVLYELRQKEMTAKLIIIGKGEMEDKIREKTRSLGLDNDVILFGATNDVSPLLSAMDIYLMPSESEGLGISAVEAQANGLPCILSDRFPEEVVMSDEVWCLPIDRGTDMWKKRIVEIASVQKINRKTGNCCVKAAGFDQDETRVFVAKLYG